MIKDLLPGILLAIAISVLASCRPTKYVVQDVQMTIKNNRIKIKPLNSGTPIGDTVMVVKMVRGLNP